MRQLILGLDPDTPPTLDNFVIGQNAELIQLLTLFGQLQTNPSGEKSFYIWGETGIGKTHLLHALAQLPFARFLTPASEESQFIYTPEVSLYLLDDCDQLSEANQIDAFALFNQVRANGTFFIASGKQPPMLLNLREDLRTRLGWSLIYQVHGLTDEDKINALELAAQAKGIKLGAGVLLYLITHYRRDMNSLTTMVGQLDHYSLENKRPITLPLLHELLQLQAN
jgi:DnaA family protein